MCDSDGRKENELSSNSKINKQFWKNKIPMGKSLLTKVTMGKSPNEMGNCPFAPPFATPLILNSKGYENFLIPNLRNFQKFHAFFAAEK